MRGPCMAISLLMVGYCQAKKFLIKTKDVGESEGVGNSTIVEQIVSEDLVPIKEGVKVPEKKSAFRSGRRKCPRTDPDEWVRNEEAGNCRDRENCSWVGSGETVKTVGCTVHYCRDGSIIRMEGGCRMCKMPGKGNNYWMPVANGQDCKDTDNPCDRCSCLEGNPPKLVVEKDGCKKPKKCQDGVHVVGDTWRCWSDKFECYCNCTCLAEGRRIGQRFSCGNNCFHG